MTTQTLSPRFSPREIEVLEHLAEGVTYSTIARRLRLSPHTVDTYLRRIRAKTGFANRTQLALLALTLQQPPPGPTATGAVPHPGPSTGHRPSGPAVRSPQPPDQGRPPQTDRGIEDKPAPTPMERPTAPDPSTAVTPTEFIAQLRRLKAWSGEPSLRQLERRTGLPRSTLALALSPQHNRLPPLERVVALVRACGAPQTTTQQWVDSWRRIRMLHCMPSPEPTQPTHTH